MHPPFYRPLFKKSFYLTAHNKYLWVLGFLAAFLGGTGQYEVITSQYENLKTGEFGLYSSLIALLNSGGGVNFFRALSRAVNEIPAVIYLTAAILIILILIIFWITIVSQAALFLGLTGIEEEQKKFSLGLLAKTANKNFWHLLGIVASTRLAAFFIFAVIGLPLSALLLLVKPDLSYYAFGAIVFVLGLPVAIIFSLIAKFGFLYNVSEGMDWKKSFSAGASLLAANWLVSLETALLLYIANLGAGAVFLLFASFLAIPFIFLGLFLSQAALILPLQILIVFGVVIFLGLAILFGSFLSTFHHAVWTTLYLKIRREPAVSKTVRLLLKYSK